MLFPSCSDSTTVSLDKATCKAKERDNAHSEWKTEVLTGAAKGETFFFYVYETQPLLKKGKHLPRTLVQQALHIALQSKHLPIACELRLSVALYIRKSDAGDIFDVWPAYEEKNPWDPIFVVMTYSNIQGEWGNVFGFRVFKRRYDFVSSEAAIVINSKAVTENPLDFSDFDKLKKVTRSRKVIKKHSNITIMNACSCRSKRGGKEICKETCVVIHCLVKGLIPYLEGPFPRSISGIPVDVREGYVTMGMNVHIPQDIQYHSMCEMVTVYMPFIVNSLLYMSTNLQNQSCS